MENYLTDQESLLEEYIPISPKIVFYDISDVKEALYNLLINMKWSEEACGNVAHAMHKIDEHRKDLKCKDHLVIVDNRAQYKELKNYWNDISELVDTMRVEIRQAQLIISTMDSKYYKSKLTVKEQDKLEKAKEKINKILGGFRNKIMGTKSHSNFDVFVFMNKESSLVYRDVSLIHQMIGPFLSRIYSTAIYEKIMTSPVPEDEEEKSWEGSDNSVEDDKLSKSVELPDTSMRSAFYAKVNDEESINQTLGITTPVNHFNQPTDESIPSNRKRLGEMPMASLLDTIKANSWQDLTEKKFEMVTVFAALKDDFKNQTKYFQQHIDFLYHLRDLYIDSRGEIDQYLGDYKLKPSQNFLENRVIPNVAEIEELLKTTKFFPKDKTGFLNHEAMLRFDIRNRKKDCQKFFEEVTIYQMPKIKQLKLEHVNKVNANMFLHFNNFLSKTMVSELRELVFEANKEICITQFNNPLSDVLKKVSYAAVFRLFIFYDTDLNNIFENIRYTKHLEFNDCTFGWLSNKLRISDNPTYPFRVRTLTLKLCTKKYTGSEYLEQLKNLVSALSKSEILNTLKIVAVTPPLVPKDVGELFKQHSFKLDDVMLV